MLKKLCHDGDLNKTRLQCNIFGFGAIQGFVEILEKL